MTTPQTPVGPLLTKVFDGPKSLAVDPEEAQTRPDQAPEVIVEMRLARTSTPNSGNTAYD